MKILNFGSLNLDMVYDVSHFVRPGETLLSKNMQVFCGGKGLNQSVALARAGAEVYHAGLIGADGQTLCDILSQNGVNTELIQVTGTPTGHAIIQVDERGENCILLFGGANQSMSREYIERVLLGFGAGDMLLLQNEINLMGEIIKKAKERGMRIAFNTAPANELLQTYPLHLIDLFICNEIEGAQLTGCVQPEQIAEEALRIYPSCAIVLTLGERGSRYKDAGQSLTQGIYPADAVDTTAAGDTFTGYFLAAISEGKPVSLALKLAARAAAMAVSVKGAAVSIPLRKDVENAL